MLKDLARVALAAAVISIVAEAGSWLSLYIALRRNERERIALGR